MGAVMTGLIRLYFPDGHDGASLMDAVRAAPAMRSLTVESEQGGAIELSGRGIVVEIDLPTVDITFSTIDQLARCSRGIIEYFQVHSVRFAIAACYDELYRRNLLKCVVPPARRPNTVMLGTNIQRLIPGLYWLTYLSASYVADRDVNVVLIAAAAGGAVEHLEKGWLLQLYEHPGHWLAHDPVVTNALPENESFFCLDRLTTPPTLTAAEYMRLSEELQREYP